MSGEAAGGSEGRDGSGAASGPASGRSGPCRTRWPEWRTAEPRCLGRLVCCACGATMAGTLVALVSSPELWKGCNVEEGVAEEVWNSEWVLSEEVWSEGVRSEGVLSEGVWSEGVRNEGVLSEGRGSEGRGCEGVWRERGVAAGREGAGDAPQQLTSTVPARLHRPSLRCSPLRARGSLAVARRLLGEDCSSRVHHPRHTSSGSPLGGRG